MHPPPSHPAFRHLDIHPTGEGAQKGIVLSDPLGLVTDQIFVPDGLVPIVSRFDGTQTPDQIHAEIETEFGQRLPDRFVADLARQFDERLLLHSPRFHQALTEAAAHFSSLTTRPPRHCDSPGYPADPDKLREALSSIVSQTRPDHPRPAPKGIIAPHIDIARGREGYAQSYGYLAECEPADLYVVFGTGHQGPGAPITGLPLNWSTPIGEVITDLTFVDTIATAIGAPQPLDLYLHAQEHSIEFQMLFLAHLHHDHPFEVAGFLTGNLPSTTGNPSEEEYLQNILEVFRATAQASGKTVCYVAGADLAHVGPFFGDEMRIDTERLQTLSQADHQRLSHLATGQPGDFHQAVETSRNPDRICGSTPIFMVASLAEGPGELLHYGQANAADGSQVVTFCSVAYT